MRDFSLRDRKTLGEQALMHLWDRAMPALAPGSNECDHIQTKFAMGQRPSSFFFGMISHMIQRAGGSRTLTHDYFELPKALQGHHFPSAMIRDPQPISALFIRLPKRRQSGCELRFGSRGSSRHRFAPVAKQPAFSP